MVLPLILGASVVDVVVALAVLLAAWAISVILIRPVAWLLGNIPVIGEKISGALIQGASGFIAWATSWAKSAVDAMVQLVHVPVAAVVGFVEAVVGGLETAAARIGDLYANLQAAAAQLWAQLAIVSRHVADGAVGLAQLVASLPGRIADVARTLIAAAEQRIAATIAALTASVSAGLAAERAARQAGQSQLAATVAGVQAAAAAALAHAIAAERAQTQAAITAVASDVAQVGASVKPVAIAAATAVAAPIAAELSRLTRECIEPTCSVISPQLDTLQALLTGELVILAGLFVQEAIQHPEAAAREVAGVTATVYRDAVGVFDLVTGAAL